MSYIDEHLMDGERVIYRSKLHWAIFLYPVVLFIIAAFISIRSGGGSVTGGLLALIAIGIGASSFINYLTSEFGITNKRVIAKTGFINRNSIEILLNKIESIHVNQDVLGRILGYGSITISGTGGSRDPFSDIDAPFEFRKRVQRQIYIAQDSM